MRLRPLTRSLDFAQEDTPSWNIVSAMADWNLPPIAKVYEAFSALADGRVLMKAACEAEVVSSSGEKSYKVKWTEGFAAFQSNDSASTWQGYMGYPILAAMLVLGVLKCDRAVASKLAGVQWKEINERFRRDYDRAVEHVLEGLSDEDGAAVTREVEAVYEQLGQMTVGKLTKRQ